MLLSATSATAKEQMQVAATRLAPMRDVTRLDLTMRAVGAARNVLRRRWRFAVLCWWERGVLRVASSVSPAF